MEENINQVQTAPIQNPVPVEPQVKTPKPWLKIGLVVLAVSVVGIGIFWLEKFIKEPKIIAQPTPALTPIPSFPADPTLSWMTFTNTDYGFSLKYPPDLIARQDRDYGFEFCFDTETRQCPIYINILNTSYESEITQLESEWQLMKENSNRVKSFDTYREFELLGIKGKRISGFRPASGQEFYEVIFPYNNKTYRVSLDIGPKARENGYRETTFDQILTTFKFLGQVDPTAEWKTYSNQKYGFSIRYPSSLIPKEEKVLGEVKSVRLVDELQQDKIEFMIEKNFIGGWMGKKIKEEKITVDGVEGNISLWLNCDSNIAEESDKCNEQLSMEKYDSATLRGYFERGNDKWYITYKGWKKGEKSPDEEIQKLNQIISTFKFLPFVATPTVDPTASWSIFTSKKGFSIRIPASMKIGETGFGSGKPEESDEIRIYEASAKEPLLSPHMVISIFTNQNVSLKQLAQENYDKNINHPSHSIILVTENFREEKFNNFDSYQYSFKTRGLVTPGGEYFTDESEYKFIWTQFGDKIFSIIFANTPVLNQILATFKFI